MNQLEIATQIYCSGKADNIELAYKLAGELMELDKPKGVDLDALGKRFDALHEEMDLEAMEALKERTAKRTQQLFDLGFDWIEEHNSFDKDKFSITPLSIEDLDNNDWGYLIEEVCDESQLSENTFSNDIMNTEVLQELAEPLPKPIDFFGGKPYLDFEMDNSICRLYKLSESLEEKNLAEEDLTTKTGKIYLPKNIMSSGECKDAPFGITIFKK